MLRIDTTNHSALEIKPKKRTDDMLTWFFVRDQMLDTVFPGQPRISRMGAKLDTKAPLISRDVWDIVRLSDGSGLKTTL